MYRRELRLLSFIIAVVFLLGAMDAASQTASTGMIQGAVKDRTGAYIPGATIRLIQVGTNVERTAQSDNLGRYSFPLLAPGFYDMEVSQSGFTTVRQTGIQVRVNEKTVLDVVLEPLGVRIYRVEM